MGRHAKRNEKSGSYNPDGSPMGIKRGPDKPASELQEKADSFDSQWEASRQAGQEKEKRGEWRG